MISKVTGRNSLRFILWAPVLFGLYVLSIGPFYWLMDRRYLDSSNPTHEKCIWIYYTPFQQAMRTAPATRPVLESYVGLWVDEQFYNLPR